MLKPLLFVIALVSLTRVAIADVSIVDNKQIVTIDCAKDASVQVLGNHNQLTLTGTCTKVTLAGNHNSVRGSVSTIRVPGNHNVSTLDLVDLVSVPGNHNTVTYKGPADPKKKKTKVGVVGKFNNVSQTK